MEMTVSELADAMREIERRFLAGDEHFFHLRLNLIEGLKPYGLFVTLGTESHSPDDYKVLVMLDRHSDQ